MHLLFEGGDYLRAASNRRNTVFALASRLWHTVLVHGSAQCVTITEYCRQITVSRGIPL